MEYSFTYSVTKKVNIPNYMVEDIFQEARELYPDDEWLQRAFITAELNENFDVFTSNCLGECDERLLEFVDDFPGHHLYENYIYD